MHGLLGGSGLTREATLGPVLWSCGVKMKVCVCVRACVLWTIMCRSEVCDPEALPEYQALALHRTDLLDPLETMTLQHVLPAGVVQRLLRRARQNHGRELRPARLLRAELSNILKEMNHVPHFKA